MSNNYLDTHKAAEIIGMHPGTLRRWRMNKEGPNYYRIMGRVRYTADDIDRWVRDQQGEYNDEVQN